MKSERPLDYAVFQLSPKRSRCELIVSSDGNTEKLASGLIKPFVAHLKVAEEQFALAVQSIKLETDKRRNVEPWFTKGTVERFVRFVSTPEVLELVNTLDIEMSQLESARRIYSQGAGDKFSGSFGGDATATIAAADATKKELLRAIDVRLLALKQDLTTACARAAAAGFNPDSVSDLLLFADRFGAHRLNDACSKFLSLCQRRPELSSSWTAPAGLDDRTVRSSYGSDMSIDDSPDHHSSYQNKHQPPPQQHDESGASTCQRPSSSSSSFQSSIDKEESQESRSDKKEEDAPSLAASQPSRRLSVQDRINLFENKQKQTSGSGSGGKPIVGKSIELRRQSSDAASAAASAAAPAVPSGTEKAVLRRWSGASDMSIDLGSDRKDSDSPLCTPTLPSSSSSASLTKSTTLSNVSEDRDRKNQTDSRSQLGKEDISAKPWTNLKDQTVGGANMSNLAPPRNKFKASADRADRIASPDRGSSEEGVKVSLGGEERSKSKVQAQPSEAQPKGVSDRVGIRGLKNQAAPQQVPTAVISERAEEVEPRERQFSRSRFGFSTRTWMDVPSTTPDIQSKSLSGLSRSGGGGKEFLEGSLAQHAGIDSNSGQIENQGEGKDLGSSEKQPSSSGFKLDNAGGRKMKMQMQDSASEQVKSGGRLESINNVSSNSRMPISGNMISESQGAVDSMVTEPMEQSQRPRQVKGNQVLTDELKLKANELEKLFAEHKLRAPVDQPISNRKMKPSDVQMEKVSSSQYVSSTAEATPMHYECSVVEPIGTPSSMTMLRSGSGRKSAGNHEYEDIQKQNISELGFSDNSKGKFYERYMQKRDAKLREEWGSRRAEKESKLKAMHDSLEQSRAEMKAQFAGSAERHNSILNARKHSEKVRGVNSRTIMKKDQLPIDFVESEEDEHLSSELSEHKLYGQDRLLSEASPGDSMSRSSQAKKLTPNRNLTSLTPRTSGIPISRSSAKASNSGPGRRRGQLENPLAQSVPNFSDLRKENTKPSSGGGKTATRTQVRNYARSRSTSEEIPLVKEEKPRRSQSLKKSSSTQVEYKDLSSLSSDGVVMTPMRFDKEQTEQSFDNKFLKTVESKPFLRKGNGIGPGSGAGIAKLRASMASELLKDEDDTAEFLSEPEDCVDMVNEEEQEEFDAPVAENSSNVDDERPQTRQEYDNSGSENGDAVRLASQVDPASVAEMPAAVPLVFHTLGSVQNSPGESPMSWNSRMNLSYSYQHETSDVDMSADSPMGSPASWNSHSLSQSEAEAARMRKKWGSAQKPVIVVNSSQNQSRKDVTKGFKRLLKFGRKGRGTDTLIDWISATTSEGDDDTEDGRDLANRSSEDLRKSRMGFSQGHPSEDGFNDSDLFNEHVPAVHSSIPAPPANFRLREDHLSASSLKAPRSFFSLSTFRSKGSESKPR